MELPETILPPVQPVEKPVEVYRVRCLNCERDLCNDQPWKEAKQVLLNHQALNGKHQVRIYATEKLKAAIKDKVEAASCPI